MSFETNIKRVNECRMHPDSCADCRLDMLHNGYNKFCYELTEEEVEVVLERSEKQ